MDMMTVRSHRPSEELLCYFVCHCATYLKIAYTTIKTYLAGIRNMYVELGLGNPMINSQGQPLPRLDMVLRGIKKHNNRTKSLRLPITADILLKLCSVLNGYVFNQYNDCMMKAACCTAFFGFLRCGEFTTKTNVFHKDQHLCLGDVHLWTDARGSQALLNLKVSKTDPFHEGRKIHFYSVQQAICPVSALAQFLVSRRKLNPDLSSPLFLFRNGRHLTRTAFLNMLNASCIQAGISPSGFSGHSFRIGAATTAVAQNIPERLVQELGRWSSTCYKTYIRTSAKQIQEAQASMSRLHP
jgi:hypothetical protein